MCPRTSLSPPSCSPFEHEVHTPDQHTLDVQSASVAQPCPSAQRRPSVRQAAPPQSMSVSHPFWTVSSNVTTQPGS